MRWNDDLLLKSNMPLRKITMNGHEKQTIVYNLISMKFTLIIFCSILSIVGEFDYVESRELGPCSWANLAGVLEKCLEVSTKYRFDISFELQSRICTFLFPFKYNMFDSLDLLLQKINRWWNVIDKWATYVPRFKGIFDVAFYETETTEDEPSNFTRKF